MNRKDLIPSWARDPLPVGVATVSFWVAYSALSGFWAALASLHGPA